MPSDSLESNWAYLVICPGLELESLALVQSDKTMGQRILKMRIAGSCAGWLPRFPCSDPAAGATSSLPAAERQRLDSKRC